ncbi:MAG: hypothetical protein QOF57_248 [Frankiaceae bacterium]|jgi:putative MATE family efflux protein|nr:hypothetical protein [Frankiaceae bacterium]
MAAPLDPAAGAAATPEAIPETERALKRRVFSLAAPIVGENVFELSLDLVNTGLVSALGAAAIAGVGASTQVMFILLSALGALAIGTSVLVAQAIGAGDPQRASRLARQSLLWSVAFSVPVAVGGFAFARSIIGLFGLAPDVAAVSTSYLKIAMATVVVLTLLTIGGGVLRGAGNSRTPMRATLVANVLNVVLAGALIYGWFGLPHLGVVGAAWATCAARSVALVLVLRALWRGHAGVSLATRTGWRPDLTIARRLLSLGLPTAAEQLVISTGWFVFTVLIARLGTDPLAAQRVAMSVLSLCFLPGWGLGMATTVLVGQSVGARRVDIGRRVVRITSRWAVLWMSAAGVLVFAFAVPLMQVFSNSPDVVHTGAAALRVMVFTQPFWGMAMTCSGALRGMSDTRTPLVVEAIGNWTAIGLVWFMLHSFPITLALAWGAYVLMGPCIGGSLWYAMRRRARRVQSGEVRIPLPEPQSAMLPA